MKSKREEFINKLKEMTKVQPLKSNYEPLYSDDGSLREDIDWSQDDEEMNNLLDKFCGIKEEER
ncbi:MAG: hypothetical protein IKN65_07355 [Clostridia bacterium]|nr:hypothetical protein [Clostridia bacterium]